MSPTESDKREVSKFPESKKTCRCVYMMLCCFGRRDCKQKARPTTEKMDDMADELANATLYFGYGSNLWKHQMVQRCPTSKYLGIARLNDYRWIINERGYANVVQKNKDEEMPATYKDQV